MLNRGFRYGDGFFETIRTKGGHAPLLSYHLERMHYAMDVLEMEYEEDLHEEWLASQINAAEHSNHLVRIYCYRTGEGNYAPVNNLMETTQTATATSETFWLPSALNLAEELKQAPEALGEIGTYETAKPMHPIFTFKTLSSAYYVLAAKYKVEHRKAYLLLVDQNENILEECNSNLLFRRDQELYMPPIDNGAVIGATLRYLHACYGFQITQHPIHIDELPSFDAIYSCKGSTGVQRIA